jgi:hypothetical protein
MWPQAEFVCIQKFERGVCASESYQGQSQAALRSTALKASTVQDIPIFFQINWYRLKSLNSVISIAAAVCDRKMLRCADGNLACDRSMRQQHPIARYPRLPDYRQLFNMEFIPPRWSPHSAEARRGEYECGEGRGEVGLCFGREMATGKRSAMRSSTIYARSSSGCRSIVMV